MPAKGPVIMVVASTTLIPFNNDMANSNTESAKGADRFPIRRPCSN